MTEQHPDTIGTIEHDGTTYEIDWPRELDDDTQRMDAGIVYRDGEQVGEFCNPDWSRNGFENEDEVLELAREFIEGGNTD